ncbi:MAG: hypothetical protein CM15mP126_8530 [Gammaproteobacteria bacterium]|nr:MAG: hypothetical protein CM15mP126_8530 [Gammaproteobacteria bacterium]
MTPNTMIQENPLESYKGNIENGKISEVYDSTMTILLKLKNNR